MNKKTVRAGIVGAGFSATFHFEAMQQVYSANVEIKGVYALEGAEAYAQKRDIAVYDSLERLLDDVDVIHCCATASAHEPIAIAALQRNKFAIVEKPLTGFFGDGSEDFNGEVFPKETAREKALASIERMLQAEKKSKGRILYAENWIYAPAIQKEREIIEKTGAQVLWIHA
jgi:predicted dehydrogenase